MTAGREQDARETLRALSEAATPLDPDARMDAYYYGFDRTGVGFIDAILSAVATAGKAYHHTESWSDEDEYTSPSHVERIQRAANAAADILRAALLPSPPATTGAGEGRDPMLSAGLARQSAEEDIAQKRYAMVNPKWLIALIDVAAAASPPATDGDAADTETGTP